MDHVVIASPASQYMSWWWIMGVCLLGLVGMIASGSIRGRLERADRMNTRASNALSALTVVGLGVMVVAVGLSVANAVANSKNYEAQNPQMSTIASRLHLHLLPSQQDSDIVENDHSLRIYLNDAGERFTGCYVERSKIDASHNSFRLMCGRDGSSAPAHN